MPAAQRDQEIMTYRRYQNVLLMGTFLLLLCCAVNPRPLNPWKWGGHLPSLKTATVNAATIVTVWTYKKTGVYYCPDSKLYGKVKPGAYMTQEKAEESGYQASGGDTCR
jgi:hypothetical protein